MISNARASFQKFFGWLVLADEYEAAPGDWALTGAATVGLECGAAEAAMTMALTGAATVGLECGAAEGVDLTSDDLVGSATLGLTCGVAEVTVAIAIAGNAVLAVVCGAASADDVSFDTGVELGWKFRVQTSTWKFS